jgi:hypothetical protein
MKPLLGSATIATSGTALAYLHPVAAYIFWVKEINYIENII